MGTTNVYQKVLQERSTEDLRLIALAAFGDPLNTFPREVLVETLALNVKEILL